MMQIILPLPDALVSEIRWTARLNGCSEGEIVREALRAYLSRCRITRIRLSDVASDRSPTVSDDDQYLADLAEPYR